MTSILPHSRTLQTLGSITCHAAMVVHVSPHGGHVQHTLATLQLASRVHRVRRKKLRVRDRVWLAEGFI